VKSPVIRYVSLAAIAAIFAGLWMQSGDLLTAFSLLIIVAIVLVLPIALVSYLSSNIPHWWRHLRGVDSARRLEQLEVLGRATRERYVIERALTLEDLRTSCLVHLLDVGGGRILCLYGQSYYDFEPIEDDPDVNQPRKFPTTQFSLLRGNSRRDVLAIFPGNTILEPIVCKPIRNSKQMETLGIELNDGAILSGHSFEEIEQSLR
jgi:hypothetical protein